MEETFCQCLTIHSRMTVGSEFQIKSCGICCKYLGDLNLNELPELNNKSTSVGIWAIGNSKEYSNES